MSSKQTKKNISGVLEHIIFKLLEKKIPFKWNTFTKVDGFEEDQIRIQVENTFIYCVNHTSRVTYYIKTEKDNERKYISRAKLLEYVKENL